MVRIVDIEEETAILARISPTPGCIDIKVGNRIYIFKHGEAMAFGEELIKLGKEINLAGRKDAVKKPKVTAAKMVELETEVPESDFPED